MPQQHQQTTPTSTPDNSFLSWGETVTRVSSAGPAPGRVNWPDAVAYREAIQNPQTALHDPELRTAEVMADRRGLPVAYSGRFAIVFRLRAAGSAWALRCFTSAPPSAPGQLDRQQRYQLLAHHTARMSEVFVPYRYIERGIKVGPSWYPVVAMRWASGEPLGRWVERHLDDPDALRTLAGSLSTLLARLEEAGVAHGDWQHDNLLVAQDGGRVTLVDYDGMYVPELEGQPGEEMGHPNYQHPARTAAHYGPGLDRFPCLVIQTALLGLARDPNLWYRFSDGESLLFKRQDFVDPGTSSLFHALRELVEQYRDEQLADSVARLQDACLRDPAEVLPPAVAPVEFAPAAEEEEPERTSAGVPPARPVSAITPPGGKWWLGGPASVIIPPLGAPLGGRPVSSGMAPPLLTPPPSLSVGMTRSAAAATMAPQDSYAFIEKVINPDTLKAESKHLWGARLGLFVFAAFLLICLYSLLSGSRHFPFYLFFWVFNLATLGYGNWPRKKVFDELSAEIQKMESLATRRREMIAQKRTAVLQGSPALANMGTVNEYVIEKLRQTDINRVLTVNGIAVSTLRQLRAERITTAFHLQHKLTIPGVPAHQISALQQWVRDLEMDAAAEYRRLTAPHRQVPVDVARLEQEAAEFDRERDRLLREKELFPDISFRTYFGRLLGQADSATMPHTSTPTP